MKVVDRERAVGRGWREVWSEAADWLDGLVVTPQGIVSIFAMDGTPAGKLSILRMVHNGRLYGREFRGRAYTARGLVRLAKRFAREVMEGKTA